MNARRNDPCPCGSGIKFKRCCSGKDVAGQFGWGGIAGIVVALFLVGGLVAAAIDLFSKDDTSASTGRVWSEEHQHWHTAQGRTPGPPPPGLAPPGKVWSEEHGHWHDAQ
jgi:hypothetical protein